MKIVNIADNYHMHLKMAATVRKTTMQKLLHEALDLWMKNQEDLLIQELDAAFAPTDSIVVDNKSKVV